MINKLTKDYVTAISKLYSDHLTEKKRADEKLYLNKLSMLFDLAFELIPIDNTYAIRDEGKLKSRAIHYLQGECDTMDKLGDFYPSRISLLPLRESASYDFNLAGIIADDEYYSINEIEKLAWSDDKEKTLQIRSPYHDIRGKAGIKVLYCPCWRYMITDDRYRELFKFILYEYIVKDLGGQPDQIYMVKFERIKREIKISFLSKIEEYKDNKIVRSNCFNRRKLC